MQKRTEVEEYLSELNESQRLAVMYNEGPSLVIAGAGSGKTRVLTYKIAYLLHQGLEPHNILALTFTNKAAREMKERIASVIGFAKASRLWMGTFHSIFSRILRKNAELIGFTSNFTIYDSADSRSLIKTIIKELGLDDKIYKPSTVQSAISNAKNHLISANAYANNAELREADKQARRPQIADIYKIYWNRCFCAGAMDFDDLLLYTNILFRDYPQVVEQYRKLFKFILVDEYQDTNMAQHLIVQQLAKEHQMVCVVGDDAQSIYSFRGANISNILNFKSNFVGTKIFKLEQNYRSTKVIVNAANCLIKKNKEQIFKNVFSENAEGEKIAVLSSYSDYEEGYLVANKIAEMHLSKHYGYNDFAILYRTNAQSRVLEETLRKRNIPYRIYGGLSFYQRKEIKDVISYFRLCVNPSDEEALKRVINYPARGIGDTTLQKIGETATKNNVSLWQVLSDPIAYALPVNSGTAKKLSAFKEMLDGFILAAGQQNAFEVAELVLRTSGIIQDVSADLTPEVVSKRENIEELLNGVRDFCSSRQEEGRDDLLLNDFLAEVSLATDQDEKEDSDKEKVTMMTVHASKGLEFKNVFIVGVEEDLFPSAMSKDSLKQIEEERRLFYVALTRAGDNCVISFSSSRFRNGQSTACSPSRFLRDIDLEYLNMPSGTRNHDMEHELSASQSQERGQRTSMFGNQRDSRPEATPVREIPARKVEPAVSHKKLTKIEQVSEAPSAEINNLDFNIGSRIEHDRFGMGIVTNIEGFGDNCKASIEFENIGKKQLLLKFARFKVIQK